MQYQLVSRAFANSSVCLWLCLRLCRRLWYWRMVIFEADCADEGRGYCCNAMDEGEHLSNLKRLQSGGQGSRKRDESAEQITAGDFEKFRVCYYLMPNQRHHWQLA